MNWLSLDHQTDEFQRDVISGLSSFVKSIPSKYLYDRRGSELFEQICQLDEYYVTRTETEIMRRHAAAMAAAVGRHACLVELGSGSSMKTRWLLQHLRDVAAYVPVDISADFLFATADRLRRDFPAIWIQPHVADFTEDLSLPELGDCERTVYYFPGSTIGNLTNEQSVRLLKRMADQSGPRCGLLIGIDLEKDPNVIHAAYNDRQGVTAAFSKNLLVRINRELGGNFDCSTFEHVAYYDRRCHQVNIGLVSRVPQRVSVAEHEIVFQRGERIHTETSRKYRLDSFGQLAAVAGFRLVDSWTDPRRYFAVAYLET